MKVLEQNPSSVGGKRMEKLEGNEIDHPFLFSPSSETNIVVLSDWWLFRPEIEEGDKSIGVAGLSTKGRAQRIFRSAPIVKRLDTLNVETKDGIHVMIPGMINEEKTQLNGFSAEMCKRFRIGFPIRWVQYIEEENTPNSPISNNDNSNHSSILKELLENTIKISNCNWEENLEDGTKKTRNDSEKNLEKGGTSLLEKAFNSEKVACEFADDLINIVKRKKYGASLDNSSGKIVSEEGNIVPEKEDGTGLDNSSKEMETQPSVTPEKDGTLGDKGSHKARRGVTRGKKEVKLTNDKSKGHDTSQSGNKLKRKYVKRSVSQSKDKEKGKSEDLSARKTPLRSNVSEESPLVSPDEHNFKRSRSGRVIVPQLDKAYQRIVYDRDGNIVGVSPINPPSTGSKRKKIA